jgi:hypothetical protein
MKNGIPSAPTYLEGLRSYRALLNSTAYDDDDDNNNNNNIETAASIWIRRYETEIIDLKTGLQENREVTSSQHNSASRRVLSRLQASF